METLEVAEATPPFSAVRPTSPLRRYSAREIWADRWLHRLGVTMCPVAVLALLWAARHSDLVLIASVLIYGAGLIGMLGCSALYHLAESGRRKEWFRCLDHAAIYFMIAATYTPFTLNKIGGPWGIGLFAFVWLVAISGILVKLLWPRALDLACLRPRCRELSLCGDSWRCGPFQSCALTVRAALMAGYALRASWPNTHLNFVSSRLIQRSVKGRCC
jgi:predicted membrane channel-forming protein YqfA (hemolysin III family)